MDIIAELYQYYQPTEPPDAAESKLLREELSRLSEQVVAAFGLDFWDRLTEVRNELDFIWDLEQFRTGFRLGVSLMLEALRPG